MSVRSRSFFLVKPSTLNVADETRRLRAWSRTDVRGHSLLLWLAVTFPDICRCNAKARRAATLRACYRKVRLPGCADILGVIGRECTTNFQTAGLESVAATQAPHLAVRDGMRRGSQINFLDSVCMQSQRHATHDDFLEQVANTYFGGEGRSINCSFDRVRSRCRKFFKWHEPSVAEPCFAHVAIAKQSEVQGVE